MRPTPAIAPKTAGPQVTLAWNPSPGAITNYNLYFGVTSGTYTNVTPVGNVTNATLSLPAAGTRYYFAATSESNQGLESVFSNEVNWLAPATPPPGPAGILILSSTITTNQTKQKN